MNKAQILNILDQAARDDKLGAVDEKGMCHYKLGNRYCAVGYFMKNPESWGSDSIDLMYDAQECLLEPFQNVLDINAWVNLQNQHDTYAIRVQKGDAGWEDFPGFTL